MTGTITEAEIRGALNILWLNLVRVLHGTYDAHGVCATAASEIAAVVRSQVTVAIRDASGEHFDMWYAEPDQPLIQSRLSASDPVLKFVIGNNSAALIHRSDLPTEDEVESTFWRPNHETLFVAPIPYPKRSESIIPDGAICLVKPVVGDLISTESLEAISAQITVYLDRAYFRQRSNQQAVEFGLVSDIAYSLSSTLKIDEILNEVGNNIRRAVGSETISVGLVDPDSGAILFDDRLARPLDLQPRASKAKIGDGTIGSVIASRSPALINDAESNPRFFHRFVGDMKIRSYLCIPLMIEQRVIGVLEAINKQNGRFDNNDLRLLQAFGAPLAIAIENAQLHTEAVAGRRRIESIFLNMSEGLLTVDTLNRITSVNMALRSLLATSEEGIVGQPVHNIIITRPDSIVDYLMKVRDRGEQVSQMMGEINKPGGGAIPVLVSASSVVKEDSDNAELIVVFSDLRQIKEIERMRDDFFHNIVHELRTPLATILMYARLLRERRGRNDTSRRTRFVAIIERESDRLQKMVRQMLMLAKLESMEPSMIKSDISPKKIFDQILPTLGEQASSRGLHFETDINHDLPPIKGTEEMLYMILNNLIENSIKFTISGTVHIGAREDNGAVLVTIKDDGIGIPEQSIPYLFQRFYRTDVAVEQGIAGTGLGLYMVKEGLERLGGQIAITSEVGAGSCFSVHLPTKSTDNVAVSEIG